MPDAILCEKCGASISTRDVPETSRQRLRSLYVPNNVEASSIISMVAEADCDLARYEEEIQRLEAVLSELKKQRQDLKLHRDESQTLLSPARKLPVEVLEQVFDFACLSDFGLTVKQKTKDTDTVTLNLSQVCSVWREIIRSRAALWSAMSIDLSHRNKAESVIEHYIALSKDIPWNLYITGQHEALCGSNGLMCETHSQTLSKYAWKLLKHLLEYCTRWENLTMRFSSTVLYEISRLDEFQGAEFGKLKSLELDWGRWFDQDPFPTSFMSPFSEKQSPNLRHLSLPNFEPGSSSTFSFDRLTSFGLLEGWSNPDVLDLLPLCRNVDSFTILPIRIDESEILAEVSPPVNIFVSSLYIKDGDPGKAIKFLNSLVAPRLQHLSIEYTFSDEDWEEIFIATLAAFLHRSQCQLQKLTLRLHII
ncbi:hypothetical protein BT96DRAFT_459040 [Gymnopus androsaceus JB14]|uniref:F-box domain-containing protein n=1 Tax=Gymnopus androsaceus JB14 TaxID=1447944 RepID=A0A6A4ILX2_9AGAR|nr:hypothetical protein BT96DRAFT_459040 [Gymnopus androsaceus JB14]